MSVIESTFDINEFLTNAVKEGASDVHLRIGEVPVVRIDGKIVKKDLPLVTEKDISRVLNIVLDRKSVV